MKKLENVLEEIVSKAIADKDQGLMVKANDMLHQWNLVQGQVEIIKIKAEELAKELEQKNG